MSYDLQSDLATRRGWFDSWTQRVLAGDEDAPWRNTLDCSNEWPGPRVSYSCPCCGFPTLRSRGCHDSCFLCGWEDDGQDDPRADEKWGGPNYYLTLTQARANFEDHLCAFDEQIDWRFALITYHLSETVLKLKKQAIAAFDAIRAARSYSEQAEPWATVDRCISDLFDEHMRQTLGARSTSRKPH